MMLKREATGSQPPAQSAWRKWIRAGSAAVAAAVAATTLAAGCLDRPVTPQEPATSNIYVAEIRQTAVDKIDLLFMIDNSISMADKQEILKQAVPVLVRRLVTPVCLDAMERPTNQSAGPGGCPNGTQAEFSPIKDIHIAIVTSSLGAHGGQVCDPSRGGDPSEDDKAYPLGRVRPALAGADASWNNTGFLAWDPDASQPGRARNNPPGVTSQQVLETQFQNMVEQTGEVGCGYEASLEAWYRFLVDPDPPSKVFAETNANGDPVQTIADFSTLDATILDLRARFLRPDSLVAIIMLTDENDCSIRDAGQSWLVGLQTYNGGTFRMPRSTSACAANPNDPCCTSCAAPTPAGCSPDPACGEQTLPALEDNVNLRCYNQKQRFGFDLLQPLQRYIDGLTQPTLTRDPRAVEAERARGNANAPTVAQNPLFAGSQRDRSLIFLAGIIGVPWQDVSTEASWGANAPLEYLSYSDLKAQGRFDWMLGPATGGFPLDGLMYETPVDRTTIPNLPQAHPGTGARLAPSAPGAGPGPNPINGKESNIADNSDLQFACIFPLATPKTGCDNMQANCDCRPVDQNYNRPLCNGTTQTHAKAYPGTRHLQVLRGFGDITNNAIIASICPKVSEPSRMNDASYGYTPAVSAIIERLKEALRGKCLPRPLTACDCDPNTEDCTGRTPCTNGAIPGQVSCSVIEAKQPDPGAQCAPCEGNALRPGRRNPNEAIRPAVERQLRDQGHCGVGAQPACNSFCLCEIQQFTGAELQECQGDVTTPTDIYGYCYIDPEAAPNEQARTAAEQIVANCPQTQQRLLRFAGDDVPTKGSIALIACLGANVQNP